MDRAGIPAGFAALTREYAMLPAGGHVLCAVSGGADSVCLLHLLKGQAEAADFSLTAAHFDHGLRGEDSRRDAAFVAQLCRDWGVPCVTGSGDVAVEAGRRGAGLEETARDLRYAFLEEAADAVDADVIATAHNAGDNVETLLLHLIRGSGLQGLAGIPPRRGRLVRPLLATSRAEITAYLEAHGLPHVEDASNADPAFARNKLRHQVLPLLRDLNPRLEESAVEEALAAVGLAGTGGQRVEEFSGGMRRRVAILRALLAEYDLLLDEPFRGLDEDTKALVMEDTRRRSAGRTVLLVTHDPAEAEAMADNHLVL